MSNFMYIKKLTIIVLGLLGDFRMLKGPSITWIGLC